MSNTEPSPGLLGYFDEQMESLRHHLGAALTDFEPEAVHQSRVATRRLKAGLDLIKPLIDRKRLRKFAKRTRKLRKLLGPLRDADVMIGHLTELGGEPSLEAGAIWLRRVTLDDQNKARHRVARRADLPATLGDLGIWWGVRRDIEVIRDAASIALRQAIHDQLDDFADDADRLAAQQDPANADEERLDVHELRIDGKLLRYTLELAAADGHAVPESTFKTFKKLQDHLGDWHDFAVLANHGMRSMLDCDLALHDGQALRDVLRIVHVCTERAELALDQFADQWTHNGVTLTREIRELFPLTRDTSTLKIDTGDDQSLKIEVAPPEAEE